MLGLGHQQTIGSPLGLVLFVLIVHAPVLTTDWPTWDSWIYDISANLKQPDIVLTWLNAEARYIEALLFTINSILFPSTYVIAYKIQLACSLALSAILISRFISRNFMVSHKVAVISTAIAFVQPHLATLMSQNIAGQHMINSCLWLGLYLHEAKNNRIRRLVGIAFVCISFDVNANLSLALGLIAVENLYQVRRFHHIPLYNTWKNQLRQLLNNWVSNHGLVTLCPFIYYLARTYVWGPHGFAHGYNKLILFDEPKRFFRSYAKSVFDIASNGWGPNGVLWTTLLGLTLVSVFIWHIQRIDRANERDGWKVSSFDIHRLLQNSIIWTTVIVPYAAVGKSSYTGPFFQWEARHGILYAGPIAASMAIVITLISRTVRAPYRPTLRMAFVLSGLPALIALQNHYFNFRYTSLAEKSLIHVLRRTPPPPKDRLLVIDTSEFLPLRPEYRFFELHGLLHRAYGNNTPLVCSPSTRIPFLRSIINDPNHRQAFGLSNPLFDSQHALFLFAPPPVHWKICVEDHSKGRSYAHLSYLDLWLENDPELFLSSFIRIHQVDPTMAHPPVFPD